MRMAESKAGEAGKAGKARKAQDPKLTVLCCIVLTKTRCSYLSM